MRRARPKRPALIAAMESKPPQDRGSAFHVDRIFLGSLEARSTEKRATMKESVLHKIAMIAAVMSVGAAAVAIDALARDGGGGLRGSHFDRSGRAYLGGSVRGGRTDTIGGYQFVGGLHHYEWFR
jgi:hypothetical protein